MSEQDELEARNRAELARANYLNKPPLRRSHDVREHQWSEKSMVCERCGITMLEFRNVPYGLGLPCSN